MKTTFTAREHFVRTLTFQRPAQIPLQPGNGRQSTRERWYQEGLPEGSVGGAIFTAACEQAGIRLPAATGRAYTYAADTRMRPTFSEKVLEVRENSQIVQDWKGNICEIGLEFTTEHLRHAIDFVTRRWIKCPVENRSDWLGMRRRYDPSDAGRYPPIPPVDLSQRSYPLQMSFSGP